MNKPVLTVVAGLLEDVQGRILLAQRPAHKPMPFLWEFPGGKLEAGETPENALVRELMEEIGVTVEPENLKPLVFTSMAYPGYHIILLGYHCRKWAGTPFAREGQEGLEWAAPIDLPRYAMPEANRSLTVFLQERAKPRLAFQQQSQ